MGKQRKVMSITISYMSMNARSDIILLGQPMFNQTARQPTLSECNQIQHIRRTY